MYHLLATPESSSILGSWERACGAFTEVLGYTWFGSIFLRNPGTHEYLVLHPLLEGRNAQDCGRFGSVAEFEETVLRDQGFVRDFLRPADLASLEARLGPPAALQVYFPVPYQFIGGSGELSTYDKGHVWVFADLVGQTWGIE